MKFHCFLKIVSTRHEIIEKLNFKNSFGYELWYLFGVKINALVARNGVGAVSYITVRNRWCHYEFGLLRHSTPWYSASDCDTHTYLYIFYRLASWGRLSNVYEILKFQRNCFEFLNLHEEYFSRLDQLGRIGRGFWLS